MRALVPLPSSTNGFVGVVEAGEAATAAAVLLAAPLASGGCCWPGVDDQADEEAIAANGDLEDATVVEAGRQPDVKATGVSCPLMVTPPTST